MRTQTNTTKDKHNSVVHHHNPLVEMGEVMVNDHLQADPDLELEAEPGRDHLQEDPEPTPDMACDLLLEKLDLILEMDLAIDLLQEDLDPSLKLELNLT